MGVYKFRVGVDFFEGLKKKFGDLGARISGVIEKSSHACFLINKDIFEYDPKGFRRRKDVGRDPNFDWDHLGDKVNGTTYVSPDELEEKLNSKGWGPGTYNVLSHNCHHFVQECLSIVGAEFFYNGYKQALLKKF
jgi:hypothetical protein